MFNKKIHMMNPAEVQAADAIMQRTLDRLISMFAGVSERGIKALFLINGGGLVTLLAYLHGKAWQSWLVPLISFQLGLMLTVLLVGLDYYMGKQLLNNYLANIKKLNANEITLSETQNYTNLTLIRLGAVAIRVGYLAGILFCVGSIIGTYSYIKCLNQTSNHESHTSTCYDPT